MASRRPRDHRPWTSWRLADFNKSHNIYNLADFVPYLDQGEVEVQPVRLTLLSAPRQQLEARGEAAVADQFLLFGSSPLLLLPATAQGLAGHHHDLRVDVE